MFERWQLTTQHLSWPQALALWLVAAAVVVWLGKLSMAGFDPLRKWTAIGLRLDLLLFLVLLLAGLQVTRRVTDLSVVAVRDVSASASLATQDPARASLEFVRERLANKPAADRIGAIRFDGDSRVDAIPETQLIAAGANGASTPGTDVAQAIRVALATLPGDTLGRLLLFWDGNATQGDLDGALTEAASRNVPIDVVPLRYRVTRELAVERIVVPTVRGEREPFTLDVILRSQNTDATQATLFLLDNGEVVDLDPTTPGIQRSRSITLRPGTNVERVAIAAPTSGSHRYQAIVNATTGANDMIVGNNAADAVTLVRGRGRILYHAQGVASQRPIVTAIRNAGLDVTIVGEDATFPATIAELQSFDAVVLNNVPRGPGGLDGAQDAMLERYVRDLGGGLLVIGGPEALGAGGWIGSATERVLPVDLNPPAIRQMPSGALVLVIDHSGSMGQPMPGGTTSKQAIANRSAALALKTLMTGDQVGVIAFDDQPDWVVPMRGNDGASTTEKAILGVEPDGGTNIYPALIAACEALERLPADRPVSVKHVLLLTDGHSASGDFASIVKRMRASGITLSTVGVGADVDTTLLSALANDGDGRFYPVSDPTRLTQVFIKEAITLRRSLLREVPFSPRRTDADAPMLAGLSDIWPTFEGTVTTWPKASPIVAVPLVNDVGDPLLSHWTAGLGRAAVFASDDGSRWATPFASSPGFDKFWQQTLRTVARPPMSGSANARIIAAGPGRARLIVESDEGTGAMMASVLGPDASSAATAVRLQQTGPGIFQGEFATPTDGAYVASVRLNAGDAWVPATFVRDGSAELRDLQSNDAAVASVAARTGGRVIEINDRRANLFSRDNLGPRFASQPITAWLIVASIGTLLADVAVRRLAWDRTLLVGLFGFAATTPRPPTPEAAEMRMAELQSVRKATADRIAAAAAPQTPGGDRPANGAMSSLLDAKRRAGRRFDE